MRLPLLLISWSRIDVSPGLFLASEEVELKKVILDAIYLWKPIISGYFLVLSRDHLKYQPYFYSKNFFRCSATRQYRYNAADVFLENAGKSYIFGEIDVCDPFLQKIKIYDYFWIFTVSQVL